MNLETDLSKMNWKKTNLLFLALYMFEILSHIFVYILEFCNNCWHFLAYKNLKKHLKILILKSESEVKGLA
jgi:hypothetical protein